jgi:N-acetylglucosamine kinase-like BadF-type ATPase
MMPHATPAATGNRDAVIGIDVGGTKTHLMRADAQGRVSDDVVVATSTWRGPLGDTRADAEGLAALLTRSFGGLGPAAAVAVGAHGCENTAQCLDVEDALRTLLPGRIRVVNDGELMAPAMGVDGGIGVVVGTGSIAAARDDDDALVTAGGWGWILGDEGSAPALVREATRAVLDHADLGRAPDMLGDALVTAFDVGDTDALALALTQATDPDDWARHAPVVFDAAEAGSNLARKVIRDAGAHLAALVEKLRERGIRSREVVAGGSVIERQPLLQQAFRDALQRQSPEVSLTILDRPPAVGALRLARLLSTTPHPHTHPNGRSHR